MLQLQGKLWGTKINLAGKLCLVSEKEVGGDGSALRALAVRAQNPIQLQHPG